MGLVASLALLACASSGTPDSKAPSGGGACKNALPEISVRGARGVVLPSSVAQHALMVRRKDVESYWIPSTDDVAAAETGLRNALRERLNKTIHDPPSAARDKEAAALDHALTNLDKYVRQYAGLVVDGSRRVLINAFPEDDQYCWRDEYVAVDDGGFWFWNMQYDVRLHQYLYWELSGR